MSPGTAYVLLHHAMGDVDGNVGSWGYSRGGMGSITKALTDSLRAAGGEVRVGAGVQQIVVKGGKAVGVVLDTGEEIRAARVVSNMDVRRTFLKHVEEKELPDPFLQARARLQDPWIVRQAEHRAGRGAALSSPSRRRAEHQGRSALHRQHREDGSCL